MREIVEKTREIQRLCADLLDFVEAQAPKAVEKPLEPTEPVKMTTITEIENGLAVLAAVQPQFDVGVRRIKEMARQLKDLPVHLFWEAISRAFQTGRRMELYDFDRIISQIRFDAIRMNIQNYTPPREQNFSTNLAEQLTGKDKRVRGEF